MRNCNIQEDTESIINGEQVDEADLSDVWGSSVLTEMCVRWVLVVLRGVCGRHG